MNTKTIIFALLTVMTFSASAQSDYSSYLNKALEKLEAGDCEAGRKFYNVYKELSGKSVLSVEELISDCSRSAGYKLGDIITVGDVKYIVVYIRDNGQHGYAVFDKGWIGLDWTDITKKSVPTLQEMKQIYANRDAVRMYDIYWTCTVDETANLSDYLTCMDFSTGITKSFYYTSKYKAKVILIHRF